ncbi:Phosphatidylglycerophosphatase GEP4, mitochondrial [Golovinomyces cichoracearum]|uniref:Phosphatidylglycerophosphatase GEP4, mitochondrial n=1 Tax=Golovinomyces cichoracearum TaxID=62708 RepID=A0A420I785_9PEZI|nr:Phosphatidylglycerophosphatase GEP4, mitochondrial [Golovinomyces cichoracearum]
MNSINISATLNLLRLVTRPNLCLPQATISTFADLPVPLDEAFLSNKKGNQRNRNVNIEAVVLDKDNCFAVPHTNTVHEPYQVSWEITLLHISFLNPLLLPEMPSGKLNLKRKLTIIAAFSISQKKKFEQLKAAYPNGRLLIVSNTAGTISVDPVGQSASEVQKATGVKVLRHAIRKPGCHAEILEYFCHQCPGVNITRPDQIAIVGDRITTDVMLANVMGSYAVWVQNGIVPREETSIFARLEQKLVSLLIRKSYQPPEPASHF